MTNPPSAPSRSLQQLPPPPLKAPPKAPNPNTPLLDDRTSTHLSSSPTSSLSSTSFTTSSSSPPALASPKTWPQDPYDSFEFMFILGGLGIVLLDLGLNCNCARSVKVSYAFDGISSAIVAYVMSMLFIHIKIPAYLR